MHQKAHPDTVVPVPSTTGSASCASGLPIGRTASLGHGWNPKALSQPVNVVRRECSLPSTQDKRTHRSGGRGTGFFHPRMVPVSLRTCIAQGRAGGAPKRMPPVQSVEPEASRSRFPRNTL